MKISIVSFSGRSDGNCSRIAAALRQKFEGEHQVTVFDFSVLSVTPCGRCRYECFQTRENCPYLSDAEFTLWDTIVNSDRALFVVPNYNDYPCANFFAFQERSQCYFGHHQSLQKQYLAVRKKFIVVSNTNQEHFTEIFHSHVPEGQTPDILFLSAKKYHKRSIQGDLLDVDEVKKTIFHFFEIWDI